MLSRAATSLTLLGRHLERADHLARILGVHVALSLDRTDEPGPDFWMRFMELAGWPGSDTSRRDQAIEMLITGTLGPSVRASVAAARLAAQNVRPSLPSELYEQVNALHWRVQESNWQPDLYPFLNAVQLGIRLVDGLVEDTMFHDDARDFVRLGKFIERTANVTRIVTRKSEELAGSPEDPLEWTAVLKSCFAFESYQARYSGGVTPERVLTCLMLDPALPRSARYSADAALDAVARIDGPHRSKPHRLLIKLMAMYLKTDALLIAEKPAEFNTECRTLLRQLEVALRETYFHPSKVPTTVMGEEGRAMPQQQQNGAGETGLPRGTPSRLEYCRRGVAIGCDKVATGMNPVAPATLDH